MVSTLFSITKKPRSAAAQPAARYVGGPENSLVKAAQQAFRGELPACNPVVLHGMTGTGKSLLVELFAAEFAAAFPRAIAISTTGADFARAYAHACDADSILEFRQRFGRCQLLALDDLHLITDKEGAQQELLHLLDSLLRRGSLVLLTLRQSPLSTRRLLPMLASRLSAGLVVPLVPPRGEARRTIIDQLAGEQQAAFPLELVQRLVAGDTSPGMPIVTVPQLRHTVIELAERSRRQAQPIAPQWLDDLYAADQAQRRATMKRIAATTAKHFQQSVADLRGQTRRHSVVQARSMAMYLCRKLTAASYSEIGRYFGNRDHTTVLHACTKTKDQLAESSQLQRLADELALGLSAGDVRS